MRKQSVWMIVVLLIVLTCGACQEEQTTMGVLGQFSTTDLDGNPVDQTAFQDYDVTMVNIWTTYCGYCLDEMGALGELSREYADDGVRIMGMVTDVINSDGTLNESQMDLAREIVSSTGADYTHMVPSESLAGLLSQIYAVPTTLFVDKDGNQVGYAYLQAQDKEQWAQAIEDALSQVRS